MRLNAFFTDWYCDSTAFTYAMNSSAYTVGTWEPVAKSWEENGPYGTVFTFGTPGVPMSEARQQLESLDSCHNADSIKELAESVGLDAAALQETVDTYNAYCKAGADDDFGKAAEYLYPVEEGPFYILEVADGYYTTVGGLEISENAEALDNDNNVIPGLYADATPAACTAIPTTLPPRPVARLRGRSILVV